MPLFPGSLLERTETACTSLLLSLFPAFVLGREVVLPLSFSLFFFQKIIFSPSLVFSYISVSYSIIGGFPLKIATCTSPPSVFQAFYDANDFFVNAYQKNTNNKMMTPKPAATHRGEMIPTSAPQSKLAEDMASVKTVT